MKTFKFFLPIAFLTFLFNACQSDETLTTISDFENVPLGSNGVSTVTSFSSGNCSFSGDPTKFWNGGIVCSSNRDTVTSGYLNQYSCIAGSGALKTSKFGVLYAPGSFTCPANENGAYTIKSIMVNNTTYAYLDMKMGNPPFSKKFVSGDWFKVSIKGFKSKIETAGVDVIMADFRDGKTFIMNKWQKVDLNALGKVDSVAFSLSSSDNGNFGMNTPAYVCIDNIEFTQTLISK